MGATGGGGQLTTVQPGRPGIPLEDPLATAGLFRTYSTFPYTTSPWRTMDYARNYNVPSMQTPAFNPQAMQPPSPYSYVPPQPMMGMPPAPMNQGKPQMPMQQAQQRFQPQQGSAAPRPKKNKDTQNILPAQQGGQQ